MVGTWRETEKKWEETVQKNGGDSVFWEVFQEARCGRGRVAGGKSIKHCPPNDGQCDRRRGAKKEERVEEKKGPAGPAT